MGTKQSIIKQAEIVPAVDQAGLKLALEQVEDGCAVVLQWQEKAEALAVTNATEYKIAGEFRAEVRSQRKVPKYKLEPFQEIAKRVTDFLKMRRQEAESQFDVIDTIITQKMDAQAARERQAAEAEQRRINEEKRIREQREAAEARRLADIQAESDRKQREKEIAEAQKAGELKKHEANRLRKEAEEKARRDREAAAKEEVTRRESFQPVQVKPNLPAIAGSRRHRNFYAEFTDFPKVLEAWRQAKNNGSIDRAAYLAKFIIGDDKELWREAREVQDSKKLESLIPGIKASDMDKT